MERATPRSSADVGVEPGPSVTWFVRMTQAGRDWVDENVPLESWQRQGPSFACEARYAGDLAQAMRDAGLVLG
jgi:hypothetical protein